MNIKLHITFTSSTLSIWLMRMARKVGRCGLADDYLCQAIECEEAARDR